jgi:hypothetical protein
MESLCLSRDDCLAYEKCCSAHVCDLSALSSGTAWSVNSLFALRERCSGEAVVYDTSHHCELAPATSYDPAGRGSVCRCFGSSGQAGYRVCDVRGATDPRHRTSLASRTPEFVLAER